MANSNDDNSYFYSLAQMVKPIRQKADSYKEKTGERYVYTPDELAIVQHANEELEKKLGKYIHDFLKKGGYSSFANQYEDLYSICLIKIFERFPEYNGQYKLTTFIARDLKLAINKYLGKEKGLSQYYNEQNVKIQKAIKEINTNGIEPTVPEISKIVNAGKNKKISEKTIRTVLDIKEHGNVCSLELCEAHAESLDSPEEEYIKGEEAQMVYDILSTLLPYERIAFKLINGVVDEETGPHAAGTFVSGCTYKDVGRQPSLVQAVINANKSEWIKWHAVLPSRVEEIVSSAKRKINANPEVMTRIDAIRQVYTEDVAFDGEDAIKCAEELIISDSNIA